MENIENEELLTADEFCQYARQEWRRMEESLGEHESQFKNECAMFGDAGPGQGLFVNEMKQEMNGIANRYLQLTGRDIRRDAYCWNNYED